MWREGRGGGGGVLGLFSLWLPSPPPRHPAEHTNVACLLTDKKKPGLLPSLAPLHTPLKM